MISLKTGQSVEKESINQLEFIGLKSNEDFKSMVGSMQNDFNGKLEIKMTDLVNRLLLEQEERMRQMNDIKY